MLSQLTHTLIVYLKNISEVLPLPWFAFLGSFIEEIIAPIPSPLVMTLAGSLAGSSNHSISYLGFLALTAAVGKTIASFIIYIVADKGEDVVLSKFGKFVGISHNKVESIGKHLNKGWRDDFVIILLRAVPIIPTAPVSIICGLIKINVRTYITSTFIGTVIRNLFYLSLGYTGVNAVESIIVRIEDFEIVGYLFIAILIVLSIGYIYYQRNKEALFCKLFPAKETKISD